MNTSLLDHILLKRHVSGRWSLVVGRWSLVVGRWSLVDYTVIIIHLSTTPLIEIFNAPKIISDTHTKYPPAALRGDINPNKNIYLLRFNANTIILIINAPILETLQLLPELPSSPAALLTVIFSGTPPRLEVSNEASNVPSLMPYR